MRAELLEVWPGLSRLFGLYPWDTARLSIDEMNAYLRHYGEYVRQLKAT